MLSADVLTVEEGSLYPALQRMRVKGWLSAQWRTSANNRRARFYTLTAAGRKQLGVEESRFAQMFGAIMRVMRTT
jgi:DNA-binding PadR family transcriptional regulator